VFLENGVIRPEFMQQRHWFELILFKACAELRAESQRSYAGMLWFILDPILSLAIYYVVFSLVMRQSSPNFVAFLCIGIVAWRWFQGAVTTGSASILQSGDLMRKVYLPKWILPVVSVCTDTFKFAVVLALLLVFLAIMKTPVTMTYVALPLLVLVQLFLTLGVVFVVAAAMPFVPDLRPAMLHGLQLVFFMSGIFFDIDEALPAWRTLLRVNPLAGLITNYRRVLMHGLWPEWGYIAAVAAAAAVLWALGLGFLRRYDRVYPKWCH
jgi:lipopolysaccharide transport system permease protein